MSAPSVCLLIYPFGFRMRDQIGQWCIVQREKLAQVHLIFSRRYIIIKEV